MMKIKNYITEFELWFHFEMGIVSDHVSPHLNEFTAIFKYLDHSHISKKRLGAPVLYLTQYSSYSLNSLCNQIL